METNYSVIRKMVPQVAKVRLGGTDDVGIDPVLTVIAGPVTGELERVVALGDDGKRFVMAAARIDGLRGRGNVGIADVELNDDAVETLRCLETVARVLAEEGERMLEMEKRYAL